MHAGRREMEEPAEVLLLRRAGDKVPANPDIIHPNIQLDGSGNIIAGDKGDRQIIAIIARIGNGKGVFDLGRDIKESQTGASDGDILPGDRDEHIEAGRRDRRLITIKNGSAWIAGADAIAVCPIHVANRINISNALMG